MFFFGFGFWVWQSGIANAFTGKFERSTLEVTLIRAGFLRKDGLQQRTGNGSELPSERQISGHVDSGLLPGNKEGGGQAMEGTRRIRKGAKGFEHQFGGSRLLHWGGVMMVLLLILTPFVYLLTVVIMKPIMRPVCTSCILN